MNREKLETYLSGNPFAKLSEVVTKLLYDEIIELGLPPRSKININQIASDFGISRTPVAEAVNRLRSIGFVETHDNMSGFFVADINLRDMMELYDARSAIECEAAALCAQRITPEDLLKLENLTTDFKRAINTLDSASLLESDMAFHRLIVEASLNKYLLRSYNEIAPNLMMYQRSWISPMKSGSENPWLSQILHQHDAIVSAIKLHLPGLAREAMTDHIKSSLSFFAYSGSSDETLLNLGRRSDRDKSKGRNA